MSGADDLTRARELMDRCLNGVTNNAEVAELNRLLAGDPEVAREWARAASQESEMELLFGPESDDSVVALAAPRRIVRRSSIAAGGLVVAAAVLVGLVFWPKNPEKRATVVASGNSHRATKQATKTVRFADGSTAELWGEDSSLEKRSENATGVDVALTKGAARFEVLPRAGRPFRVWVEGLHVDVVGTVFTVERRSSDVRVSVEHGSVRVISGLLELHVAAGSARLLPLPEPSQRIGAPASGPVPGPAPQAAPGLVTEPGAESPRPVGRRDEPGALLKASDVARQAGRPEEARKLLERILDRHPRDPRAAYAAFILGRVLLDELGRPREAAAAFARVAALDPRTPLAQDALAREVESWFHAGDESRVRDRAREYLSRYPDGRRRDQVRRYSRLE